MTSKTIDDIVRSGKMAEIIEFVLDCLWILSQCVIGFAAMMLMIAGGMAIRNTYHDTRQEKTWKKKC